MHFPGINLQNNQFTMPSSYLAGRFQVTTQVNVLPFLFKQAFFHNAFDKMFRRTVVKQGRRCHWFIFQDNRNGMTLIGPDLFSILTEDISLFVIGGYDGFQRGPVDCFAVQPALVK